MLNGAPIEFELVKDVPDGGVLFALLGIIVTWTLEQEPGDVFGAVGFLSQPALTGIYFVLLSS
jgi:hypothetical protein